MIIELKSATATALAVLLLSLAGLCIGTTARAGSIFDDDYVPSVPPTLPPITPPAQSNPITAPAPDVPAVPRENPSLPQPDAPVPAPQDSNVTPLVAVPSATDQARSRKLFKEAFAGELKDHTPAARKALADKLLAAADKVSDNASDRFVLLIGACDAAGEASDLQLLTRAAKAVSSVYKIDSARLAADVILNAKSPLKVSTLAQASAAVNEGLDIENSLAQAGDYVIAARVLTALQPIASHVPDMAATVRDRGRELSEMRLGREHALAASELLKKKPDDPAANESVGEYFCFHLGDYPHGLPSLVRGDDAGVRAAAKLELDGSANGKTASAIGDAWWNLADKKSTGELAKTAMRQRAVFWYSRALDSGELTGLSRIALEKRIASAPAGPKSTYLSALKETDAGGFVVDSWWGLGKDGMVPSRKNGVMVDGIHYVHAIGYNPRANSTAHVNYDLAGGYREFSGAVGLEDGNGGYSAALTFKIIADGTEIWHSQPFRDGKASAKSERFNVSVDNVKTLEVQTYCDGGFGGAHCIWIEPRLESK